MTRTSLVPPPLRARPALAALGVFVLGLLVYATLRETTRVLPAGWLGGLQGHALVRGVSDSFPSFAHAFAFALAGGLWLARDWRQALQLGLGLWCLEAGVEVLQHAPLHDALGSPRWVRLLFVNRFDPQDLLASAAGVAAAWGTLAAVAMPRRDAAAAGPEPSP
jgi:hypothetical protein